MIKIIVILCEFYLFLVCHLSKPHIYRIFYFRLFVNRKWNEMLKVYLAREKKTQSSKCANTTENCCNKMSFMEFWRAAAVINVIFDIDKQSLNRKISSFAALKLPRAFLWLRHWNVSINGWNWISTSFYWQCSNINRFVWTTPLYLFFFFLE